MRVDWTENSESHLKGIHDFIVLDSPRYAEAMIDRITRRGEQCGVFPFAGSRVPEYGLDHIREVLEHPYRIIYRIESNQVNILAVIHGARRLPDLPP